MFEIKYMAHSRWMRKLATQGFHQKPYKFNIFIIVLGNFLYKEKQGKKVHTLLFRSRVFNYCILPNLLNHN